MSKLFADALSQKLKDKGLRPIDLEKKTFGKLKRANLSRIINQTPHHISGALPKIKEPTVELIAKTLDWDLSEARQLAGYSPLTIENNPQLIELTQQLSHLDETQREIALSHFRLIINGLLANSEKKSE